VHLLNEDVLPRANIVTIGARLGELERHPDAYLAGGVGVTKILTKFSGVRAWKGIRAELVSPAPVAVNIIAIIGIQDVVKGMGDTSLPDR
jgi:hypothetical protein